MQLITVVFAVDESERTAPTITSHSEAAWLVGSRLSRARLLRENDSTDFNRGTVDPLVGWQIIGTPEYAPKTVPGRFTGSFPVLSI